MSVHAPRARREGGTHLEFCVTCFSWLRCCAAASRPVCKLTSSGPSSSLLSPAMLTLGTANRWYLRNREHFYRDVRSYKIVNASKSHSHPPCVARRGLHHLHHSAPTPTPVVKAVISPTCHRPPLHSHCDWPLGRARLALHINRTPVHRYTPSDRLEVTLSPLKRRFPQ